MNLTEVSHNIILVKKENTKWLDYAYALTEGLPLGGDAVPRAQDDSLAYRWLFEHDEEIRSYYHSVDHDEIELFNFDIVEQIVILRYDFNAYYLHIFKTYLPTLNNSMFTNLFRSKYHLSEDEIVEAKSWLKEMQQITDALNKKLDLLEAVLLDHCKCNTA